MITKKLITEDLKLSRSQGKVHLKYKGKQLAVISEANLFQLIIDASPMSFLKDLAKIAGVEPVAEQNSKAVIKLVNVYAFERLASLGKKPISLSDTKVIELTNKYLEDKKIVADFKKALLVMRDAQIRDCNAFIHAQVEGLKFVNDGKGTFPTPKQLTTANALNRVFDYTASNTPSESGNKTDKPKHYWFFNKETDGSLTLKTNSKYREVITKIEAETATLEECIYAQKFYAHRRSGQSYAVIDNYISKISK